MKKQSSLGLLLVAGMLAGSAIGCSQPPAGGPGGGNSTPPTIQKTEAPKPGESGTPGAVTPGGTATPGETGTPGGGTPTPGGTGTPGATSGGPDDEGFDKASSMPGFADVKKIGHSPVPSTPESIAKGKELFNMYCATCHGESMHGDGPGAAAITTGPPRDLTKPDTYKYGTGQMSIYRTDKFGIPSTGMAAVAAKDDELWNIANYIRSKQGQ